MSLQVQTNAPAQASIDTDISRIRIAWGWGWMILPGLIILAVTFLIPIAYLASFSLRPHLAPGTVGTGFTLENYYRFLSDGFYVGILFDTLILGILVVTICLLLAYPVAYFLARSRSRYRGFLLFLILGPLLIATVVRNLGWYPILGDSGMINWL